MDTERVKDITKILVTLELTETRYTFDGRTLKTGGRVFEVNDVGKIVNITIGGKE